MELCNTLSTPRALRLFASKTIDANCLVTDAVRDCVISTGDRIGGLYQVTKFDPRVVSSGPSWGLIVEKKTTTVCVVQLFGLVEGVYTSLAVNKVVWVGLDSRLTTDPSSVTPLPSAQVFLQQMGTTLSSDVVLLLPQTPFKKVG